MSSSFMYGNYTYHRRLRPHCYARVVHTSTVNAYPDPLWTLGVFAGVLFLPTLIAMCLSCLLLLIKVAFVLFKFAVTVAVPVLLTLSLLRSVAHCHRVPRATPCRRSCQQPRACGTSASRGQVVSMSSTSDTYHLTVDRTHKIDRYYAFPVDATVEGASVVHEDGLLIFSVPRRAEPEVPSTAASSQSEATATKKKKQPTVDPVGRPGVRTPECPGPSTGPDVTNMNAQRDQSAVEEKAPGKDLYDSVESEAKVEEDAGACTEEKTGEKLMEKDPLYLAGYQRALEDMKMELSDKDENDSGSDSDVTPEAHQAADDSLSDRLGEGLSEEKFPAPLKAGGEAEAEVGWLDEWDTLLDDLEEMGFDDRVSNREALAKHEGRMNRAIKQLAERRVEA